eukprot:scaffold2277_cov256-Pinguiococcus_pyrenoidosus.AAC.22
MKEDGDARLIVDHDADVLRRRSLLRISNQAWLPSARYQLLQPSALVSFSPVLAPFVLNLPREAARGRTESPSARVQLWPKHVQ